MCIFSFNDLLDFMCSRSKRGAVTGDDGLVFGNLTAFYIIKGSSTTDTHTHTHAEASIAASSSEMKKLRTLQLAFQANVANLS